MDALARPRADGAGLSRGTSGRPPERGRRRARGNLWNVPQDRSQFRPCSPTLASPRGRDPDAEERTWREAGARLGKLHARENDWLGNVNLDGTPKDAPQTDAEAFVGANWEANFAKSRTAGLFDAAELDCAEGRVREGQPSFRGERPRAVHRDFTPRNWTVHPDGRLAAVIDFEHARWDVRAGDLNRPWDLEFRRNPRLVDAFYDGYGDPGERLRAKIATTHTMLVFTSVVWATGVGDGAYARRNREALHRMMGRTQGSGSASFGEYNRLGASAGGRGA